MLSSCLIPFWGAPSFFKGCCRDVARRNLNFGYEYPGHQLASHLRSLIPYGAEFEEWQDEVDCFAALLEADEDEKALSWLVQHYPRCLALIPVRRRRQFLKGVYNAYAQGDI